MATFRQVFPAATGVRIFALAISPAGLLANQPLLLARPVAFQRLVGPCSVRNWLAVRQFPLDGSSKGPAADAIKRERDWHTSTGDAGCARLSRVCQLYPSALGSKVGSSSRSCRCVAGCENHPVGWFRPQPALGRSRAGGASCPTVYSRRSGRGKREHLTKK